MTTMMTQTTWPAMTDSYGAVLPATQSRKERS